ncbi:MAG: GNAT family N-acetyltransferase [Myxococcota bacterium]
MLPFDIRPLDPKSQHELDEVCVFSVMTLWESRPEMRVDPKTLPHFGFEAHRRIITAGADNGSQQYLVARDAEGRLAGHSIVIVRHGDDGVDYGYLWSRYVLPRFRRQGLARTFLHRNLDWLRQRAIAYAEVHVHVENHALRQLFESEGFRVVDRRSDQWTYLVLRHDLL